MLATDVRAGVRSDGERLRFGGASEGEEMDMETDPSSASSPSPSLSHAPSEVTVLVMTSAPAPQPVVAACGVRTPCLSSRCSC